VLLLAHTQIPSEVSMARIVIDGREILGTTGRYIRKLLEYLQQIDYENDYVVLLHQKGYDETEFTAKNFTKVVVNEKKFSLLEQFSLPNTIKTLEPDLVHFSMTNQPVLMKGKVVTTIHDLTPIRLRGLPGNSTVYQLKSRVFGWVTKKAAKKSAAILTGTNHVKQEIVNFTGVSSDKIIVTPEAADEIPGEAKTVVNLVDKKFIFYAGRAQPHKNLEKLIQSFEILYTSQPELYLVLVGKKDSSYERTEKLAAQSPARENIVFTGFIEDVELKWLYQNTQVYVFPSLSEGFGLPGLEAMVHGCPVVSSNATCLPEVYEDAAIYFDPSNPQEIAEKISSVLNNSELRQELIIKGHSQAAKYSWRRMSEQTLSVYKNSLN
jgi:glycosyltransferase involved in cell wall biosynthesis